MTAAMFTQLAEIASMKMLVEFMATGRPIQENFDSFNANLRAQLVAQDTDNPEMRVKVGFILVYTAAAIKLAFCDAHGVDFKATVNWEFPDGTTQEFATAKRPDDEVLAKWVPTHVVFNEDNTDFVIHVQDLDAIKAEFV